MSSEISCREPATRYGQRRPTVAFPANCLATYSGSGAGAINRDIYLGYGNAGTVDAPGLSSVGSGAGSQPASHRFGGQLNSDCQKGNSVRAKLSISRGLPGSVESVAHSALTALEMRSQQGRPFGLPAIAYVQQAQAEIGIARVVGDRHDGVDHVPILGIQP
jgi:hypothetical protein